MSQLKFDGRFSHLLIHRFLTGFNIQISYGEITEIIKRNSNKLLPLLHHLKTTGVRQSSFVQSDATGAKRRLTNGKVINQYLNFLGTKFLSIFKITEKYNAKEMNKLLGVQGRKKSLVSDDGSPNNACSCKGLQLCLVHEIRLYKKLFPFFNPHQELQKQILFEWRQFYHFAKAYGSDPPKTATSIKRAEIESMFETLTNQTTGYDDLDKQLRLSLKKKPKLLYFLDHPEIPIQNNESELSLREGVIMRKISGPTKSTAGDRSIERHLSVIQTIKKQGLPVFKTLHGFLTGQLSPSILTLKTV
jgi:transposase